MGRCGQVWTDVGRCGQMWAGVDRCGQVWTDLQRLSHCHGATFFHGVCKLLIIYKERGLAYDEKFRVFLWCRCSYCT